MKGVRVVLLVQNLPVPFDRRVWQEARALRAAGALVVIICPSDGRHPSGSFQVDDIRILRYPAPREAGALLGYVREYAWALCAMTWTLFRVAVRGRPTVIHFCNPPDLLFLIALPYKFLLNSRLIFDQHDLGPELIQAKHLPFGKVLVLLGRTLERLTYWASDHVISTNESYAAIAKRRGGIPSSAITVVRSAPDESWDESGPASQRWRRGRAYQIGYVGVIGRQEGLDYLVRAAQLLAIQWQLDVQVCIVGSGPDLPRIEGLVEDLGLSEHFSFLGRLPDADLRSVLASSDVCVNPDEVNDMNNLSTMNKIMEYMALGRPIVQFDVREGRFSAQDSSLYAKPNDGYDLALQIKRLLTDPDLASAMGQSGRRRFERELAWPNQASRLLAAYARTMASRAQAESSRTGRTHGGR